MSKNPSISSGRFATVRYTIAGTDTIYVLEMPRPKKVTLTKDRDVKFAIEKSTAFVIDDNGDELKMNVWDTKPNPPINR